MPSVDNSPTVGLNPTTPFMCAGHIIEPLVSVPIARVTSPAATATADPELEPQGVLSRMCGFFTCPPTEDQPLTE